MRGCFSSSVALTIPLPGHRLLLVKMRFIGTLPFLLAAAVADYHVNIPEIIQAVDYALSEFEHWQHYSGPTGTATAVLHSTTTVQPTATATPTCAPYWLENIEHQGISAFNPDKTYQVFRNVKDFGAKGSVLLSFFISLVSVLIGNIAMVLRMTLQPFS